MTSTTKQSLWTSIPVAAFVSVLGTLLIQYVLWGRTMVSRADVETMLNGERRYILETRRISEDANEKRFNGHTTILSEWKTEQKATLADIQRDIKTLSEKQIEANALLQHLLDERNRERANTTRPN